MHRGVFHIVGRYEAQEFTYGHQAFLVVPAHKTADSGGHRVHLGPAESLLVALFVGGLPDDIGPSDEHLTLPFHHKYEIGQGGRIAGPSGTRPHNGADLRYDS